MPDYLSRTPDGRDQPPSLWGSSPTDQELRRRGAMAEMRTTVSVEPRHRLDGAP